MIVSDITRRVRNWLGDNATTFATDANIIDCINDATLRIAMQTEISLTSTGVSISSGTQEYALPADFIFEKRVVDNATKYRLKKIQKAELDLMDRYSDVATNTGTPDVYYIEGTKIGFNPIPNASGTMNLTYVKVPTLVTTTGDTISLPTFMHPVVARYVFGMMKEQDEDFEAAERIYLSALTDLAVIMSAAHNPSADTYATVRDVDTAFDYAQRYDV